MPKWLVLLAGAPLLLAANGEMSVEAFLTKALPLEKAGHFAIFRSDFRELIAEVRAASQSYRADLAAQKKAGDIPHSCPPEKVSLSNEEVMALMRAVPEPERATTSVKQALASTMKKRFPCPDKRV